MRRIVVVVPELLGEPSVLRRKLPTIERMSELGRIFKLAPMPRVETPEALFLGLRPDEGQLRQGPLTVSALGADPPVRSTHFHLSLMSFADGVASAPKFEIPPDELREILALSKKLNSKLLTIVEGHGLDHGLVWESLGDLQTTPAREVDGHPVRGFLPEGDAELLLRRLIDDSVNLLSEIELNERRVGENLQPFNLFWPWGNGVRMPVPNLALQRGEPALVISGSMRMQGLARLAGYRHPPIDEFGTGLNTKFSKIAARTRKETVTIVLIDSVSSFRALGKFEEVDWLAREIEKELLQPIFHEALLTPSRVSILAVGNDAGLGVSFETNDSGSNSVPFDERALEEKLLPALSIWDSVRQMA